MKKKIVVSLITIVTVSISLLAYTLINTYIGKYYSQSGIITFQVISLDDVTLIDDELEYVKGQSLFELLSENYELTTHSSYNSIILGIDDFKTDWNNNFFAIYVNDKFATVGAKDIYLKDQDVVKFKIQSNWGSNNAS